LEYNCFTAEWRRLQFAGGVSRREEGLDTP